MSLRSIYLSLALITFTTAPTIASCYGTGYARYCDGRGGPGATYSPRGNYGGTNYYNKSGGYSRRETYTPQRNNTYYNNGGYNSRPRSRSGDYFGF